MCDLGQMGPRPMEVVWEASGQMEKTLSCWDYAIEFACLQGSDDLQLAAELGKNLLERNKELENNLKHQQKTIEEQAQEIEYMKKQTAALREVNDSRLKVYEQLEVSIQDLEQDNHRLGLENTAEKKQIKSQRQSIETLEASLETLQKKLDELTAEHETLLRRQNVSDAGNVSQSRSTATWKAKVTLDGSIEQVAASQASPPREKSADTGLRELAATLANDDEITDLLRQLHEVRNQKAREQKRVVELEDQLSCILEERSTLEGQLSAWQRKAEDMKSLQDEISALEEVRQGHLCGRCLRGVGNETHDALSIMLDQEEDDDLSLIEPLMSHSRRDSETPHPQDSHRKSEDNDVTDNPYRVLVEKYEALLEVQRHPASRRKMSEPDTCLSLQEELVKSGDFNCFAASHTESDDDRQKATKNVLLRKKPFSGTPTDFSEAESSSSGFSDETSNKATQTDGRPGSFLCSIADGEDCRFSIYDDASPIESRFRKTPEYRQLFHEIFAVLKRAAETKDEGEKLPLLDDLTPTGAPRVPPVTPAHEEAPSDMTDDARSVVSSVVSEPACRCRTPTPAQRSSDQSESDISHKSGIPNSSPRDKPTDMGLRPVHTPKRPSIEYLSIGVNVRKKTSVKKNSAKKSPPQERPTTPESTSPKTSQGKPTCGGRRKFRALTYDSVDGANGTVWNGNTLNFFSSKVKEPATNTVPTEIKQHNSFVRYVSESHNTTYEYKPSTASAEVARLKRLEMSYAEALRLPNKPQCNARRH